MIHRENDVPGASMVVAGALPYFAESATDGARIAQGPQQEESDFVRLYEAAAVGDAPGVAAIAAIGICLDSPDVTGFSALHLSASRGHEGVVATLLANGAQVDVRSACWDDLEGCTPLHVAAAAGHSRVVALLIQAGADLAARDECAYTPLHLAAQLGHRDVVKRLVLAGAPVNAVLGEDTPLGLAIRHRQMGVVGLLRQVGGKT